MALDQWVFHSYSCRSPCVLYSQAFQRQVHERLTQLELVNKQYRRLARENRTDAASKLKIMVHEGNQRWDSLQKRVAAILRRLKVRPSEIFKVARDNFSLMEAPSSSGRQLKNVNCNTHILYLVMSIQVRRANLSSSINW